MFSDAISVVRSRTASSQAQTAKPPSWNKDQHDGIGRGKALRSDRAGETERDAAGQNDDLGRTRRMPPQNPFGDEQAPSGISAAGIIEGCRAPRCRSTTPCRASGTATR